MILVNPNKNNELNFEPTLSKVSVISLTKLAQYAEFEIFSMNRLK